MLRSSAFATACLFFAAEIFVSTHAHAEERPFLFAQDANTTAPGTVDADYRVTIGVTTGGAIRPLGASGVGSTGSIHEVGAEVGLLPRLSVRLYGLGELGLRASDAYATAGAEARVRVLGAANGPLQLTLGAGGLREFSGDMALQGRVVASAMWGPMRFTADVLFEHSFRMHADPIDVIVTAGASYAITSYLRAGVEYMGQDFEAEFDPAELEGPRHLLGPTLAVRLLSQRLQIVGGPSFGLTPLSPPFVVRLGIVGTI